MFDIITDWTELLPWMVTHIFGTAVGMCKSCGRFLSSSRPLNAIWLECCFEIVWLIFVAMANMHRHVMMWWQNGNSIIWIYACMLYPGCDLLCVMYSLNGFEIDDCKTTDIWDNIEAGKQASRLFSWLLAGWKADTKHRTATYLHRNSNSVTICGESSETVLCSLNIC